MEERDEGELAALRASVRAAHARVQEGRYEEAHATFAAVLLRLEAVLGPRHPEVEELRDDLETVLTMRDVYGFGRQMGFRSWTPAVPPGLPEPPEE